MLLVYFVIAAVPLGYLLGGRLRNYLNAPLKMALLPCIALLIESSLNRIADFLPFPVSAWLGYVVCAEYLLLAVFVWLNRHHRGMKLLGASTAVNFSVIAANGFRMPVTPIIYEFPELASFVQRIEAGELPEYVLVGWDGPLWFLGDTIPIFGGLASVGDILMAASILLIIVFLMKAE